MRAITIKPGKRRIELTSVPAPEITDDRQVRIQTLEVGVCGTDREICSFAYGTPPAGLDYLVLGHEALGRVVEIGSQVSGLRVGDLVVPSVRRPCPHDGCAPCAEGRQDYCFTGDFTERGIKEAHGFMSDSFVESETYLFRISDALRNVAVLVEPLTIAEKAIAQVAQIQGRLPWGASQPATMGNGKTAVVLGAGPIGILGAMALVVRGFRTFVYSRSPAPNPKAALCSAFGATYVSSARTGIEELAERTGPVDLVYEALGAADVAFEAMKLLGPNGVVVFTGIPPHKAAIPIDADILMREMVLKNQAIVGTVNADGDAFRHAIVDLALFVDRWPEPIAAIIGKRFLPDDYAALLQGRSAHIKDVIRFD